MGRLVSVTLIGVKEEVLRRPVYMIKNRIVDSGKLASVFVLIKFYWSCNFV
jgi:hypothetical protein